MLGSWPTCKSSGDEGEIWCLRYFAPVLCKPDPPSLTPMMQRPVPWRRRFGEDTMETMLGFLDTLLQDGLGSKQVRCYKLCLAKHQHGVEPRCMCRLTITGNG